MSRIAVVGAGAMGSYFAASLAEAGNSVTVIDVDQGRLDLIATDGIVVSDDRGERTVRVSAKLASQVQGPVDWLIIFTKGMHTQQAAASARHLADDQTAILTLQNGLGNDAVLADAFGADRVVIGMTDVPVDLTGPNLVASHGAAKVVVGDYIAGSTAKAEGVAALLRQAGFTAQTDGNVRGQIWEKVAFNASMNATAAVTGLAVGGLDSEAGRRIIAATTAEVADVAQAEGIVVDRQRIARTVENALENHVHHKPSMLQDVLAGRRTEIENINGAVARLGKAKQVPTPVNHVLADLVRMIEGGRRGA